MLDCAKNWSCILDPQWVISSWCSRARQIHGNGCDRQLRKRYLVTSWELLTSCKLKNCGTVLLDSLSDGAIQLQKLQSTATILPDWMQSEILWCDSSFQIQQEFQLLESAGRWHHSCKCVKCKAHTWSCCVADGAKVVVPSSWFFREEHVPVVELFAHNEN